MFGAYRSDIVGFGIFFIIPYFIILFVAKNKQLTFFFLFSYLGVVLAMFFDWLIEELKKNKTR